MQELTRNEIESYLIDALCLSQNDFDDCTTQELVDMLEENGELGACYDYNNKSNW